VLYTIITETQLIGPGQASGSCTLMETGVHSSFAVGRYGNAIIIIIIIIQTSLFPPNTPLISLNQ
jgi:hypothetical protein